MSYRHGRKCTARKVREPITGIDILAEWVQEYNDYIIADESLSAGFAFQILAGASNWYTSHSLLDRLKTEVNASEVDAVNVRARDPLDKGRYPLSMRLFTREGINTMVDKDGYGALHHIAKLRPRMLRRGGKGGKEDKRSRKEREPHSANVTCNGEGQGIVTRITHGETNAWNNAVDSLAVVLRYLIVDLGADISLKTKHGFTPLHIACAVGNLAVVPYLVGGELGTKALLGISTSIRVFEFAQSFFPSADQGKAADEKEEKEGNACESSESECRRVAGAKFPRLSHANDGGTNQTVEQVGDASSSAQMSACVPEAFEALPSVLNILTKTCDDRCHGTALHLAMACPNKDEALWIIVHLVALGADPTLPNGDGDTAIEIGLLGDDEEKCRALLDATDALYGLRRGVPIGGAVPHSAKQSSEAKESSTDIGSSARFISDLLKHHEIVESSVYRGDLIIKNGLKPTSQTPLALLEKRNADGQTLLHRAVLEEEHEMLNMLIRLGAVVNTKDWRSNTTLMMAVYGAASMTTFNILLEAGADPNAKGWDGTALHACFNYNTGREALEWVDVVDYSANVPDADFISVTVEDMQCQDGHPLATHFNGKTTGFSCDCCQASMWDGVLSMRCTGDCMYDLCADCVASHLDLRCSSYTLPPPHPAKDDAHTPSPTPTPGVLGLASQNPHALTTVDKDYLAYVCSTCTKIFRSYCGFECKECNTAKGVVYPRAPSPPPPLPAPAPGAQADPAGAARPLWGLAAPPTAVFEGHAECLACACQRYKERASSGLIKRPNSAIVQAQLRQNEVPHNAANQSHPIPFFRRPYEHSGTHSDLFQTDVPVDYGSDYQKIIEIFDLLVKYGGDVNARDHTRCTPLHRLVARMSLMVLPPDAAKLGVISEAFFVCASKPLTMIEDNVRDAKPSVVESSSLRSGAAVDDVAASAFAASGRGYSDPFQEYMQGYGAPFSSSNGKCPTLFKELIAETDVWFLEGVKHGTSENRRSYAERLAEAGELLNRDNDDDDANSHSDDEEEVTIGDDDEEEGSDDAIEELTPHLQNGGRAGLTIGGGLTLGLPQPMGRGEGGEGGAFAEHSDLIGLSIEDAPLLLFYQLVTKYQNIIDFDARDHQGSSLLHHAARYASPIAVATLLKVMDVVEAAQADDEGADDLPNSEKKTTAETTRKAGKREKKQRERKSVAAHCAALSSSQLSPSAKVLSLTCRDMLGRTPLHLLEPTAGLSAMQCAALLLHAGTDLEVLDAYGNTPMMMAVRHRDAEEDEMALTSFIDADLRGVSAVPLPRGINLASLHDPSIVRSNRRLLQAEFSSSRNHFVVAFVRMLLRCGAEVEGPATSTKPNTTGGSQKVVAPLDCCCTVMCEEVLLSEGAKRAATV